MVYLIGSRFTVGNCPTYPLFPSSGGLYFFGWKGIINGDILIPGSSVWIVITCEALFVFSLQLLKEEMMCVGCDV